MKEAISPKMSPIVASTLSFICSSVNGFQLRSWIKAIKEKSREIVRIRQNAVFEVVGCCVN